MSAEERLQQIAHRAESATEGPWGAAHPTASISLLYAESDEDADHVRLLLAPFRNATTTRRADAEFAAHARTDVPDMVAGYRGILALHTSEEISPGVLVCRECCIRDYAGRIIGSSQGWPCNSLRKRRSSSTVNS